MRTYVKPDLYYENFELSAHVATCEYDMPNSQKVEACYVINEYGDNFFTVGSTPGCKEPFPEIYCYTNGSSDANIFNS